MALKVLMLRKEQKTLSGTLEELRKAAADLEKREADLAQSIEEAETQEERDAVSEEVETFEEEKADNEKKISEIERKIEEIESEIAELERAQEPEPEPEPEPAQPEPTEKREEIKMATRTIFEKLTAEQRRGIFESEEVKSFLGEVRNMMAGRSTRAITGEGVIIPDVFIGMIRENIMDYSKLYRHVNVRQVRGNAREIVMGTIPEAVWTDCCGKLNELDLTFNDAEVYCWKVGGFFAICNATLEDNDVALASEIVTVLGQAIGLALDKAILYGTGTRMPLGVVTRLAQTSEPADYPATARTWVDLHTKNITDFDGSSGATIPGTLNALLAAKGRYSRGQIVYCMNETTYTLYKIDALANNAAGAIVSGVDGTMPVAGGIIEVLDFIPDGDVIAGYFDLYLLAERAGIDVQQSREVLFLDDRTAFKGTARYDGLPVIAEGFVVFNINDTAPTTEITFAPDTANEEDSE